MENRAAIGDVMPVHGMFWILGLARVGLRVRRRQVQGGNVQVEGAFGEVKHFDADNLVG